MAYSTGCRVLALIPNLVNGASDYSLLPAAGPASAQIAQWMSSGCALIETRVAAAGYQVPVTAVRLGDYLADLEATYAAYRAEKSRTSPRTAPGQRGRADLLKEDFDNGLKDLVAMDLTGVSVGYTAPGYVAGTSESDKTTVETNTDRVEPRFGRGSFSGQFKRNETAD